MNDVASLLGWLPMPSSPTTFTELLARTDEFLAAWWIGGDHSALNELVATWTELIAHPVYPTAAPDFQLACHDRIALALSWRAVEDKDVSSADAARQHMKVVLHAQPDWLADARYHSGILWYNRALVTNSDNNAGKAIGELKELLADLPTTERRLRHRCQDVLGRTLLWMYQRDESSVDLSELIDLQLEALRGFPPDAPYRVFGATAAASALRHRFKLTGRLADLELAIEVLEHKAVEPIFSVAAATSFSMLGMLLRERYLRSGSEADLDEALTCHANAVRALTRSHRIYPMVLTNYGNSLLSAFERHGKLNWLNEAIEAQTEVVEITAPDDPLYPSRLNNLANSLSTSFDVSGDAAYLTRAIDLYRESIARAPATDFDLPSRHYNLANVLTARGEHDDLQQSAQHYRTACHLGLERSPEWALGSALAWGGSASQRNDWAQAAEAFELGTRAIELLFAGQSTRQHKETWLRQAQGVPARSAYAFARLGRPEEAILVQERGRTLLLAEALRQRQTAVRNIAQMYAATATRPLVYLSPSDDGGVALIVDSTRSAIHTVYLPNATASAVEQRAQLLLTASNARTHDTAAWRGSLDAIGRWAYNAVLGPVLTELDRLGLTDFGAVTLVPSGQLALLPLHLAWEPADSGRHYALDRIAMSYAPSAQALSAPIREVRSALVVDEPLPVSAPRLPWSWIEQMAVEAAVDHTTALKGAGATRTAVLDQLRLHDVVHLSCHGIGHPDAPLESALIMANDAALTLRDVIALAPQTSQGPRLVVLSACETDQAGSDLPDEVVSFPTGLLQAGCQGVIATQWAVSSIATALLVAAFYRQWPARTDPARALRFAQRWLRDATCAELASRLQADRAMDEVGLPPEAAHSLWTLMRRREPDETPFAHPTVWAAFAHVGV